MAHTSETRLRVRYAETDQMGVVYYANYLRWFERERSELMIGICFRGWPLSTQNYPDDPVRARVPEPQAAKSENRLARTPISGADRIREDRSMSISNRLKSKRATRTASRKNRLGNRLC